MTSAGRRLWRGVRSVIRIGLITWVLAVVVLSTLQRRLMYHPTTSPSLRVADNRVISHHFPAATDVELESSGGTRIGGWLLRTDDRIEDRRPLVLLFHGNAGHRGGRIAWYTMLGELGCDVLAIDYQGYGDSQGSPTQAAVEADALAAWSFAESDLGYSPDEIFVMGVSLGGAAAVHVAAIQSSGGAAPAGLITVATFSSMLEVASSYYPWFPVRAVLLDQYPSSQRIPQVTSPFIHFHGDSDRVVRDKFGKRLFERAPEQSASGIPRRWVTLPATGHNDVLLRSSDLVREELAQFVASVAAASSGR